MTTLYLNGHAGRGFTVIELSIVLVIIGLLIGGVLVARDLINASQLRSVMSQIERYDAAVMTFKGKYGCLPGDCPKAAELGLGDASCPATFTCNDALGGPIPFPYGGCNGDGDEKLDNASVMGCPEEVGFWRHLSDAGLIEGHYDGRSVNDFGGVRVIPIFGRGAPVTRVRDVGITTRYTHYLVGYDMDATQNLAKLTATEAQWIDAKMDDGSPDPSQGTISALSMPGQCYLVAPFRYNATSESARCAILIPIPGFR